MHFFLCLCPSVSFSVTVSVSLFPRIFLNDLPSGHVTQYLLLVTPRGSSVRCSSVSHPLPPTPPYSSPSGGGRAGVDAKKSAVR